MEQINLTAAAGVSISTIKRLEAKPGPLNAHGLTEDAIRRALEAAGVEFTDGEQARGADEGEEGQAVRKNCDGIRCKRRNARWPDYDLEAWLRLSYEAAEDHPVKVSDWKRVWIEEVASLPPTTKEAG